MVWSRYSPIYIYMYNQVDIEWCPPGRRKKGRPRNSWMQEVTTGMREKGINTMEWIYRAGWKIKTLSPEKHENIDTLYINK